MKCLSWRTRIRLRFWRVRRWWRRIHSVLTGSITVTATRVNGDGLYGETVYCVTRTADGEALLVVHRDGTETVIPFEELGAFLVTAY